MYEQLGAYFSNISIGTEICKTYEQVLNETVWTNADNKDYQHLLCNIFHLIRKIYFVNWGSDSNKSAVQTFINNNNWDGDSSIQEGVIYNDADGYVTNLNKTVKYIESKIDNTAPEVIIDPTNCDLKTGTQTVNLTFSDRDSGFKNCRYCFDTTQSVSGTWSGYNTSSTGKVTTPSASSTLMNPMFLDKFSK